MKGTEASTEAQKYADLTGFPHTFYWDSEGPLNNEGFVVTAAPEFAEKCPAGSPRAAVQVITEDGMEVQGVVVPPERELDLCNHTALDSLWLECAGVVEERTTLVKSKTPAHRGAELELIAELGEILERLDKLEKHVQKNRSEQLVVSDWGFCSKTLGFPAE